MLSSNTHPHSGSNQYNWKASQQQFSNEESEGWLWVSVEGWHYIGFKLHRDQEMTCNLQREMTPTPSQSHPSQFPYRQQSLLRVPGSQCDHQLTYYHSNRSACKCFTNPEPQKGLKYLSVTAASLLASLQPSQPCWERCY